VPLKQTCSREGALTTPEQLQVVTSKGYQGGLKDSVRYTSAGMMKGLNTNMTGLNVSYALQLIGNEKLNSSTAVQQYSSTAVQQYSR
jgi:hypothetical protein